MVLGLENLALSSRVTVVVLPVAFYFLILGLLNSRRHPQLLSGKRDFALLVGSFCPLFVLPLAEYLARWPIAALAAAGGLVACVMALAPRGPSWVIYNLDPQQIHRVIGWTLDRLGLAFHARGGIFYVEDGQTLVQVRAFPLLRNGSVRLRPPNRQLTARFERALAETLARQPAQTSPATAALLLVATAMMVVPFTLVASRAGEIVRIIGDLIK